MRHNIRLALAVWLFLEAQYMADAGDVAAGLLKEIEGLRLKVARLEEAEQKYKKAEVRLRFLVEGTSSYRSSQDFIHSLTRSLASALGVKFAFMSELVGNTGLERCRLVSFWTGADHSKTFEYDIKGTPCENVVAKDLAYYPSGVQRLFPGDAWLKEASIESYLAIPLFDASGAPIGHMGVMDTAPMEESRENEDILRVFAARASSEMERMRAEHELAESRRMLETLMANLPGMAYRFANDRPRTAEFVSNGCLGLTGYAADDFTGKKRSYGRDIMHPSDRDAVFMEIQAGIESRVPFKAVYRILPANGRERWVWEQGSPVFSDDGTLQAVEGFITDITDTKRAEDRIRTMATFDSLTGLPNRVLFFDRLEKVLAYAQRYQHIVAVLFVDLDDFKSVNDNHGHQAGDTLLQDVAGRLSSAIRASDTVARMGGDEFTFLLLDIQDKGDASIVARKVIESVARPFIIGASEVNITCSIGIAVFPADGKDEKTLLSRADTAMYRAKKAGGNRYFFYEEERP